MIGFEWKGKKQKQQQQKVNRHSVITPFSDYYYDMSFYHITIANSNT